MKKKKCFEDEPKPLVFSHLKNKELTQYPVQT